MQSTAATGAAVPATSTDLEHVIALGVAEVARGHLGAHVPAAEGAGTELDAAAVEHHSGDGRQRVPLQTHVLEPRVPAAAGRAERQLIDVDVDVSCLTFMLTVWW